MQDRVAALENIV